MNNIFTKSKSFRQEYSATIIRIEELKDIENSDNLKQVIVDGFSVVVNKNDVHKGDYMVYCRNETELNSTFLSVNNMYEMGERERNANYKEVQKLIDDGQQDKAKALVGYFNKNGRVKMIRLRGCPSMGVLMRWQSFVNWNPKLKDIKLSDYVKYDTHGNFIPFDFDTIDNQLFIKAYIPRTNYSRHPTGSGNRKRASKFDRMIEGQFEFHYDTNQLNSNMWKLTPDTIVDLSVKVHGTSIVLGNILVKQPTLLNKIKDFINKRIDRKIRIIERKIAKLQKDSEVPIYESRLERKLAKLNNRKFTNFATEYYNIYSSRTVIKNRYINRQVSAGDYSSDIWGEYNELLKGKIPHDITIYGEIVGYLTGSDRMIQKGYDYGCEKGTNKLMIYRVSKHGVDINGNDCRTEYEISDVIDFINQLLINYPSLSSHIMPFTHLWHGTLSKLYPNVAVDNHWNANILEAMKNDKTSLGMELDEPLCNNKVPREGICVRIVDDPVRECFKLKSLKFLGKEAKEIDQGNVDIEMSDNYQQ